MKPVAKLFLKTFLINTAIFGTTMYLVNYPFEGYFSLLKFIGTVIGMGAFMASCFVYWHISQLKSIGVKEFTEQMLKTEQEKEIISSLSKTELLARLKKKYNYSNVRDLENEITFRTKISDTWGEKIRISVQEHQDGINTFIITSKPRFSFNYLDFGRNLQNIMEIERLLLKGVKQGV